MSTEDTTTRFHGRYVTYAGRTMLRAAGGEIDAQEEAAPVTESAAPDAAVEAPAGPPEGFIPQERYENLRAEHNRKQALWDRAQQGDTAAMRELNLPLDFGDEQNDPEDEGEASFQDPRVDALLQERAQEREQAILNDVSGHIDTLLTEAKIEVPPLLKQSILSTAWLRGNGAQITPEVTTEVVNEWVAQYKQLEQAAGDRWLQSKKNAPYVSPGGTGATDEVLPLDASHKDRVRYMTERFSLGQQQS